jgi:Rieske Fe-S protein
MNEQSQNSDHEAASSAVRDEPAAASASRRGFLTGALAAVVGTVVGLVPVVAGLLFFLDPLLRKKSARKIENGSGSGRVIKDENGFIKLSVTRDSLPDDGTPQMSTVIDDIVDAWNMYPNQPRGTVWLRKNEDGSVLVLNATCPHLGCSVDFRPEEGDFFCPCHTSAFALKDGQKTNQIPPRGMDHLELKQGTGDEIWVKYQNFKAGDAEQIPI